MLFLGVVPVRVRTDTGLYKQWQKPDWPQVSSALAPSHETLRKRSSIVDRCHCLFVHLLQKSEFQPFLKWTYFCSRGLCKVSEQVRSSLTERMSALCQARSGWQDRKAENEWEGKREGDDFCPVLGRRICCVSVMFVFERVPGRTSQPSISSRLYPSS